MTIDVGTGDGRAVLATAAAEPASLVIGLDADAAAMAESSRRAARRSPRGGLPNALYLVAAAEALPPELARIAGRVTVRLPWGSLLRGCLGGDEVVARSLAGIVAPGGVLELLLAPAAKDRTEGLPVGEAELRAAVTAAFHPAGLRVVEGRPATLAELRSSRSSWARRLLTSPGTDRTAILLRLRS